MNAQQLKNSILQEAIMGKLVPQDPNDEPASVLLEKIRKEKARLVKEGKLKKKDLEETPISKDEMQFELPKGWKWCHLGDVGVFERGNGIKRDETSDFGYPCVRYGEMYTRYKYAPTFQKTVSFTNKSVFEKCRKAHKGDLFMALTGENKQDISLAAMYVGDEEIAVGGDLCHFTILEAYALYFVYLINSKYFSSKKEVLATGDIIVHISTDKLASITIPLPPLAEQHRIVAKIEELLPKVEEYGKAQEALDKLNEELPEKLKKSILQEAISGKLVPQDPNDEPASVLLDKIRKEKARLVKEGKLKKKDLEETRISEDEIPFEIPESWEWINLSLVTSLIDGEKKEGDYVCLDAKFLRGKSSGEILKKGKFVKVNDNIILVDGENSGEVFTVPCDGYMGSTFKQLWVSSQMCLPYVLFFIKTYKDILRNSKKGAAIPHLNKEIFNNLKMGLPPLAEQHRIVAKIEQLMKEIDKLKK